MAEKEELKQSEPIPEPTYDNKKDTDVDVVEEMEAQQAKEDADKAKGGDDTTETPPPRPPRPLHPFVQAEQTLKEAFPNVDGTVIRAVLVASSGNLENASNGLLAMNDSDFDPNSVVFESASRTSSGTSGRNEAQIKEDERLARQLAQQYGTPSQRRQRPSVPERNSSRRVWNQREQRYEEEPERSFFDDELPEIQKNLQKGFNETRDKVSNWVMNLKKRIDENAANASGGSSGTGGSRMFGALGDSNNNDSGPQHYGYGTRRGYDRDPDEITDDFRGVSLRNNEDDLYDNPPPPPPKPMRPGHAPAVSALGDSVAVSSKSKWEPLKASEGESEEKDPFFIGSDDEDEDEDKSKADKK